MRFPDSTRSRNLFAASLGVALVLLSVCPRALAQTAPSQPKQSRPEQPRAASAAVQARPKSAAPRPQVDGGPTVISSEAAAAKRKPGVFENMEDRYGSIGEDVPPWRKTQFFGIQAKGQFFVYVVDCSESMLDEDRLIRAKRELRRSVNSLQFPQRFKVLFYNDRVLPMPGAVPKSADTFAKDQLAQWLTLIEPHGGTEPRMAMNQAIGLKPDAIFLLSDGAFPDGAVEAINARNAKHIPIHCIDLAGGQGGDHLKRIAQASGGKYVAP